MGGKQCIVVLAGLLLSVAGVMRGADSAARQDSAGGRLVVDGQSVAVQRDEGLLGRYRYGDVPFKPYLGTLCTPSGVNVLRDAPADHKHHHGLMYAVDVDGVKFWEENEGAGKELGRWLGPVAISEREGLEGARFGAVVDWVGSEGEPVLREWRQIGVYAWREAGATLVVWRSRLQVGRGKESATLKGSHYHGLGMRFVESMDTGGEFLNEANKEGEVVRGEERLVEGNWCAYTAAVEGKEVTVAMFDGPGNARQATWFTMTGPFSYMSATMNTYREPLKVERRKGLSVCYGVVLWDGRVERERIEKAYEQWQLLAEALAGPMVERRSNDGGR